MPLVPTFPLDDSAIGNEEAVVVSQQSSAFARTPTSLKLIRRDGGTNQIVCHLCFAAKLRPQDHECSDRPPKMKTFGSVGGDRFCYR
jgi:hypothetical protein